MCWHGSATSNDNKTCISPALLFVVQINHKESKMLRRTLIVFTAAVALGCVPVTGALAAGHGGGHGGGHAMGGHAMGGHTMGGHARGGYGGRHFAGRRGYGGGGYAYGGGCNGYYGNGYYNNGCGYNPAAAIIGGALNSFGAY
jgi:hypothetical protein